MEEYLRKRYRDIPPDLVLVLGAEALDFVVRTEGFPFPGTPVVFGGVAKEELGRSMECPA